MFESKTIRIVILVCWLVFELFIFDDLKWAIKDKNINYGQIIEGPNNNPGFDFLLPLSNIAIAFECNQSSNDDTKFNNDDLSPKIKTFTKKYCKKGKFQFRNLKYGIKDVFLCFLTKVLITFLLLKNQSNKKLILYNKKSPLTN